MNIKESNEQFKTLHLEILRTHANFVKKHEDMGEVDEQISAHFYKGIMSHEDISNYVKALDEAYEARKRWAAAQLKYFQFIENQKMVASQAN